MTNPDQPMQPGHPVQPGSPPPGPPAGYGATPFPGQPMGGAPAPDPGPSTPAEPSTQATPYGFDERGRVRRTKISGVWVGLIAAGVVLILLLIFIAQNLHTVGLHFLGFYGKVSVGLAMLVAALCGLLIALVPGTIRILQLRKALRRNAPDAGSRS